MPINSSDRKKQVIYMGVEAENTPMKGHQTLFVTGLKTAQDIIRVAKTVGFNHISLGVNQSFNPVTPEDWKQWDNTITKLLEDGYWVTLNFDAAYAKEFNEEGWCESETFIPVISVKLPCIKLFNYNTVIKIDDTSWGETNSGVWCHYLHDLMGREAYHEFNRDYFNDTPTDIQL